MKEADLMRHIQIECCKDSAVRLWRNNNGQGWVGEKVGTIFHPDGDRVVLANARVIRFGLGEGTGDLIGGKSVIVTPDMVGQRVFKFANLEIKTPRGRTHERQKTFIDVVNFLGGLAGIARNVDEARKVLTLDDL